MTRVAGRLVLALAAGLIATSLAGSAVAEDPLPAPPLGPGAVTVVLDVEHSRFTPERLRVAEGTEVRFVVVNGDPIGHELIVGPPEVHAVHRSGTHAEHPPVPGEVSVPALQRGVTRYAFDEAGTVAFVCHLPGHEAFGMTGEVEVVPAGS